MNRLVTPDKKLNWPLMKNNITRADLEAVIEFLRQHDPILTQSRQVEAFEQEWSDWLGVKHSVFVNSGSAANLLTMLALRHHLEQKPRQQSRDRQGAAGNAHAGEVIVPTLTWVSDIVAVIRAGFKPVFVDIDPRTMGMDVDQVSAKITSQTKAVFLTHILGFNALTESFLDALETRGIPLIEDVCESYGATFQRRKLGTFGLMSNFSFYYGHHMTTIEGGMVSTNDPELYQILRMGRAHGLVREANSESVKQHYRQQHPDLNPEFIFALAGYNLRSTEINAVIGRSQLKRLDEKNAVRRRNFQLFLENLDSEKYFTDFRTDGNCNYAFTLVLKERDDTLCEQVMRALREHRIEFRRGTSGGGNQLRQPYLKDWVGGEEYKQYPNVDHIHFYGFYIGNYPSLEPEKIKELCAIVNNLPKSPS